MKWGVHKNSSTAYRKASKKLSKLEGRRDKLGEKSRVASLKSSQKNYAADKASYRRDKGSMLAPSDKKYNKMVNTARTANQKASKANIKYEKAYRKAEKWSSAMTKSFAKVSIKDISEEDLEYGKRYTYMLMRDDDSD